jgi:hypothetical protein
VTLADGHLLLATALESTEDVFLVARLDENGAIVWQRILGRYPSARERNSHPWQHDVLGAPVSSVESDQFVVAFGSQRIHVHSLDPETGVTLAEVAGELTHDGVGRVIPWIPLSITAAPHHHQIVARSCVYTQQMCGLTSLKWTGEDSLPAPVLKLWFDKFSFPGFHDWTHQHEARLVLATREWEDDTPNWWMVDLPDSCEGDRVPGTIPREIEFRLPY